VCTSRCQVIAAVDVKKKHQLELVVGALVDLLVENPGRYED
jgi:hypothetical protein